MDTLVGFKHPNEYGDFLIKPSRKANDDLIEIEWPNIQRIMASLAQKDVDASHDRPQARQLCPAEPNQESLVGIGEYLPYTLHPRIY